MAGSLVRAALPALGFGVAYALATELGRATRAVDSEVSLLWPAAAVATLWAIHLRTLGARSAGLQWGVLAALTFGINLRTGAGLDLSLWFVLVNLALAAITSGVLSYGGRRPRLRDPLDLGRLIVAVAAGTLVAGLLAVVWFASVGRGHLVETFALFTVRNGVAALGGVAIVLRLREHRRTGGPVSGAHLLEGLGCLLVTAGVLAALWALPGISLAFLLSVPALWVALRFSIPSSAVFIVATAAAVAVTTIAERGPYAGLAPVEQALLAQGLVGTTMLTVLALSLHRDSRTDLITQLRHLAQHDPLTGLANRALLIERIERELQRPRSQRPTVGILYIDLDGFKQINDAWGHREGDLVLSEMAGRISAMVDDADLVARIGGDEFVVACFTIADQAGLHTTAERVRAGIAVPYGEAADAPYDRITASIGTALAGRSSTARSLLVEADRAMYDAKRSGRNRTLPSSYVLRRA
ncbi:diguanylate cyclase [Nocardioides caeni]|uniref:Sensor domain-containing diguanylate cyclase n=1 Tax=Nocardioides caeni TaxID=574700 RepID=A0A4S8NIA1_9ACTN|nr:diguanylate cyclase [Nocardioides caeni]THV16065.1 sensor domain-containing diguanylate cyclase [Nocardioides caeni]